MFEFCLIELPKNLKIVEHVPEWCRKGVQGSLKCVVYVDRQFLFQFAAAEQYMFIYTRNSQVRYFK